MLLTVAQPRRVAVAACVDTVCLCLPLHLRHSPTYTTPPTQPQVKLPQRVPHGFHAMWVTGQQIKQQNLPGLALQQQKASHK